MNASSASLTRLGRTKSLVLAALLAAVGMLALAGVSKAADTHTITIDKGKLTLGAVFPDNTVIPADVPGPLPFPPYANADASGTMDVVVDGGNATVAEADFKMPTVWVPKPGDPDTHVPILMTVPGGLSGTWAAGTGELSLTGNLRIAVITGTNDPVPPSPLPTPQICQIDAPGVTWSTGLNAITPGVPFTAGLDGNGAVSAAWTDLPNGVEIDGGDCSTVNAVIHDNGAIWLSSGVAEPPAPPVCEPPLEGDWPNCEQPPTPPGPTPTVKKAKITKVKVGNARVKRGKKVKVTIKVTNKGNAAFKGKIALKSSKKKVVKIAKSVKITVPAGKTKAVKVVVKTTRKAKGKAVITAKVGGKTGKGKVTVRR